MSEYDLSYIISSKNRLHFLKITLNHLIQNVHPNEEIVVIDGNSSDGSKEYLQKLFKENKIHQYISETDENQAHGWNKAMLLARGVLIKKIIDDDVFEYNAIRRCADFMFQNPDYDLCISNSLTADLNNPITLNKNTRLNEFIQWRKGVTKSFSFSDVYLLIRRSSLSKIGLFNTQFVMMDWEFSLRASYLQCKIAYYTGYTVMGVNTPGNITSKVSKETLKREGKIGSLAYEYKGDSSNISIYSKLKIKIGKIFYKKNQSQKNQFINFSEVYPTLYRTLEETELQSDKNFIVDV
ncbi:glycosyltransferase [Pedobacter rhodius]|uniref:Glycosyltransferase n=1 Tax=Pedobacter rhodius TaxID=3004098 RepID=A0ABT4KSJ0_9SPHI|nr:glycosyltransferase [Pedobacter sp. SJ11]MCZ4221804.1 glycosyltransferase [Pedobacter sp. SJ11]